MVFLRSLNIPNIDSKDSVSRFSKQKIKRNTVKFKIPISSRGGIFQFKYGLCES